MTILKISSIVSAEEATDILTTISRLQKLTKIIISEKESQWNNGQFAEFFRLIAADNLLNYYSIHTPEGYAHALTRWKKAEEATQKAYREENFI